MKLKKIKNIKISEAFANKIIELYRKGSLKPGDKLPTEMEFTEMLGVSRTAIREGLQRLRLLHILEVLPGRGTFISKDINKEILKARLNSINPIKDKKMLKEILEFRRIIEVGVIGLVINNADENGLINIRKCIKKHEKDLEEQKLIPRGDLLFHQALAEATKNRVIIDFFNNFLPLILTALTGFPFKKEDYNRSLKYNRKIFENILKGNSDLAKKEMNEHFDWLISILS